MAYILIPYILTPTLQVTDLPDDLCFSAFHRKGGHEIPYERKSDDKYEARAIFRLFRGQITTLGQIKKKILLETPFVYHAKAMRALENAMKIILVRVDESGVKRRRGTFLPRIPMSIYSRDLPGNRWKYGNYWLVSFAKKECSEAMELYLSDRNEFWMLLAIYVEDRMKVGTSSLEPYMTRKELTRGLGRGKDGERIGGSVLAPVLKMMIDRKVLVKGKRKRGGKMVEAYKLTSVREIRFRARQLFS